MQIDFCKSCIKPSNQNNLFFSRPFTESTLTALVNIFVGFLGAFILNYLAKRLRLQIDFAKVAFGLAGISTILMMMALNTYDRLWLIVLGKLRFLGTVQFFKKATQIDLCLVLLQVAKCFVPGQIF